MQHLVYRKESGGSYVYDFDNWLKKQRDQIDFAAKTATDEQREKLLSERVNANIKAIPYAAAEFLIVPGKYVRGKWTYSEPTQVYDFAAKRFVDAMAVV
jgi:hypothetical protein